MQCSQCSRTMRPFGAKKADAPDTIAQGGRGLCANCVKKQGQPVDSIDDSPAVLVRAVLRPSTYKAFARHAKELHIEVGDLLSRLADRAVGTAPLAAPEPTVAPVEPGPKPIAARGGTRGRPVHVEDPIDRRIRTLNADGLTDTAIARAVGMSQPSVSRRRRLLGLQSPRPRGPNRKAA
ncbi:AsnC family protein [Microbacterium paraoxydans]|uniref:Uncharacterized protein n=1 Tax=Microbacterium paraoxydans TaxID=199592 RepID=A0A1H1LBK5_9MICO|nr:AsnC family protein [Microbacterium paraoxydans]SDR71971.1 hypothetical protein SAMN04489809_0069 [Microbacterium paraoxydans]